MRRRDFLFAAGGLPVLALPPRGLAVTPFDGERRRGEDEVIGMYIHEGWPFNHPYAARTWTVEDFRGYADGLKKIGFNTLIIWPILETMPDPLTLSDRVQIGKTATVIDMLHDEFGMKAYLTLCPNIIAKSKEAARYTFDQRPLFGSMHFVNPGDPSAVKRMVDWREELFRPLAKMDGIAIIDSDPGGYPGSTNQQFVNLLSEHRKMLNRLRPGIELCYWMHEGWEGCSHFYATGKFAWGTPPEAVDVLKRLKKLNPVPWQITIHTVEIPPNKTDLALAERMGLASNSLAFKYGAIEGEPSFPMTNFGGDVAFKAGRAGAPGGVVGNAQTHCVQLPNTFAFVRGARGQSLPTESDYVHFADDLIPGQGEMIVRGWQALAGKDPGAMREMADKLEKQVDEAMKGGRLKGLLFGSPQRFFSDLALELRMKAAYEQFVAASAKDQDIARELQVLVSATKEWQARTGYQSLWIWPDLDKSLRNFDSQKVNHLLNEAGLETINRYFPGRTPFERVQNYLKSYDHFTPQLIDAMSHLERKQRT